MELLKELVGAFGMPGWEGEVRDVIRRELEGCADTISVDRMGNIIAVKNPDAEGEALTLTTHMDETGLMVKSIDADGFIRFASWDVDKKTMAAKRVLVGEKKIPGVIGSKPVHSLNPEEKAKIPAHTTMFIDIGAKSKEEALALTCVGEYIGYDVEFSSFGDGWVTGRCLDARVGCAAIIEALKSQECPADRKITAVFTSQKNVGSRGASTAANQVRSDILISVDGYTADYFGKKAGVPAAGSGPAVLVKDRTTLYPRSAADSMISCAKTNNIPCSLLYSTEDKGDSGSLQRAFGGAVTIGVVVPVVNARTPAAVMKKSDYENTVLLLRKYISELSEKNRRRT